jgi:hypothetical protein
LVTGQSGPPVPECIFFRVIGSLASDGGVPALMTSVFMLVPGQARAVLGGELSQDAPSLPGDSR